ncbi:MAG: ATP-dependent DNA helicase RecG [Dehalococcoidia bacterium]|nr:ATP-dependent DNA helicase RecG [Dehalococcoidia bacterium]MDW8119648.1 ATP-dependent DNA helicase RecG [Chloroflexota bacterium]
MRRAAPSRLDALRGILTLEARQGFADRAVAGGLDRFLDSWRREAQGDEAAVLQRLDRLGLFARPYRALAPPERRALAQRVWEGMGWGPFPQDTPPHTPASLSPSLAAPSPPARMTPSSDSWPPFLGQERPMPKDLSLTSPVRVVAGVGPVIAASLEQAGLSSVRDLLHFFPRKHIPVFAIADLVPEHTAGQEVGIVGTLWEVRPVTITSREGRILPSTEGVLGDETGNLRILWFNQEYVARVLQAGQRVFVTGYLEEFAGRRTLEAQSFEVVEDDAPLFRPGALVPVYPSVRRAQGIGKKVGRPAENLSPKTVRRVVRNALEAWLPRVPDWLPPEVVERVGVLGLRYALWGYHYPSSPAQREAARRRLAFNEFLLAQLLLLQRRHAWQEAPAPPIGTQPQVLQAFLQSLPFRLTRGQERALAEILNDMAHPRPMARLLQGEVGSGKTVVALTAMLMTAVAGWQSALMAPTEVLAEQHFLTIRRLLGELAHPLDEEFLLGLYLPFHPSPIVVGLLIGSMRPREKEEVQGRLGRGAVDIVVGTHALIQEEVTIPRLGLAVVDEQQRFGVLQRRALRQRGERMPHLLVLSATPIPRSLALALYGDLEHSVLEDLPHPRKVITRRITPDHLPQVYDFIRHQVAQGRQAFVLCPLIEESEALQARAAQEEYEHLSRRVFPDLRVGLLHGRMPLPEKHGVMERFRKGELDILVATPVIEVGIDVPNATVMLIQSAERFGLAELHQLRGRVGRGPHPGYCILVSDDPSPQARERLEVLVRESNGFRVAEEDLRLRGEGEVLGTRQSGLPTFRVARLEDRDLLALAREEARRLLEADPTLTSPRLAPLREELALFLKGAEHPEPPEVS